MLASAPALVLALALKMAIGMECMPAETQRVVAGWMSMEPGGHRQRGQTGGGRALAAELAVQRRALAGSWPALAFHRVSRSRGVQPCVGALGFTAT